MVNKITALLKLTRIEHSLLLIVAVIAAELIAGGIPTPGVLLASLLSPALVSAGAFAINDYYDVEADRANKRTGRPLVSGALKRKTALRVGLICFALGSIISVYINTIAFVIIFTFAVLAWLYSLKLKDIVLVGNVYVAFTYMTPFIFGNFVVSKTLNINILLIALSIFVIGLAREIYGMIRDTEGDKMRKSQNLIACIGERRSAELAVILVVEGIILSLYLFVYQVPFKYNLVYIIPITAANLIVFYIGVGHISHKNNTRAWYDRARNLSLIGMGIALLAYLFSAVFYLGV